MRINISEKNLDRLEAHAMGGFDKKTEIPKETRDTFEGLEWLTHTIEVSDDVADKLAEEYETATDCSFDEPLWQFNEAIQALLDRLDRESTTVH